MRFFWVYSSSDVSKFNGFMYLHLSKGANPQRVSTEIIIEIKQFNAGRMASHPFIEGIIMMFPLRNTFTIENGLLD